MGGPGGRARVADPRSCPILSSRSCSRRSRSTSSGFRAAPCGDGKIRPGEPVRSGCCGVQHPHRAEQGEGGQVGISGKRHRRNPLVQPPPHKAGSSRGLEITHDHTAQKNSQKMPRGRRKLDVRGKGRSLCPCLMAPVEPRRANALRMAKGTPWPSQSGPPLYTEPPVPQGFPA